MVSRTITIEDLNALDTEGFVAALSGVFEHSDWVARAAAPARPFGDPDALHAAMAAAVENTCEYRQLALIRAHPDLAGKAALAGDVTAASAREQSSAGLDRMTPDEYQRFHRLNDAYRARFGFPFIICVRHHDKGGILSAFERRLGHTPDEERAEALCQIAEIARLRLADILAADGPGIDNRTEAKTGDDNHDRGP